MSEGEPNPNSQLDQSAAQQQQQPTQQQQPSTSAQQPQHQSISQQHQSQAQPIHQQNKQEHKGGEHVGEGGMQEGLSLQAELLDMGFELKLVQEALKITTEKDKAIEYIINTIESDNKGNGGKGQGKGEEGQGKGEEEDDSDFEDDDDSDYKMIFLVRMDLKMGLGKMAAQVAHATLKAYKQMEARADANEVDQVNFFEWMENGQKKIVVKVNSEAELLATLDKAKQCGLNSCYIRDAGLTQIASGSLTVGAIGPAAGADIDALTKQYKLL